MNIINDKNIFEIPIVAEALDVVTVDERKHIETFINDFMSSWTLGIKQLEQLASVEGFSDALINAAKIKFAK